MRISVDQKEAEHNQLKSVDLYREEEIMFFFQTIAGIISNPVNEFNNLKNYYGGFWKIFWDFLIYIFLINSILGVVRIFIHGSFAGGAQAPSIIVLLFFNLVGILGIYLSSRILNFFAPKFNCEKNFGIALNIVSFTSIYSIMGNLLSLVGMKYLGTVSLLYLIVLRYHAVNILFGCKKKRLILAMIPEVLILIPSLILYIAGFILQQIFFLP